MSGGEMPQAPLDPIASNSISHSPANDKANPRPAIEMPLIQMPLI